MHLLLQQSPTSTQAKLQPSQERNESGVFTPKSDPIERHQYKVRSLKPSVGNHHDFVKFKSLQNVQIGSCFKCRELKEERAIRLCQCQHITYHSSCILNHIHKNPEYGISLFQCQHCSEYFQIKIQEKYGLHHLTIKEQTLFFLILFVLCCFLFSEIIIIAIITFQIVYQLLIIISIILELVLLLISIRLVYKRCQSVEFDFLEYDEYKKLDQEKLQKMVRKILETLNAKKTLRTQSEIGF